MTSNVSGSIPIRTPVKCSSSSRGCYLQVSWQLLSLNKTPLSHLHSWESVTRIALQVLNNHIPMTFNTQARRPRLYLLPASVEPCGSLSWSKPLQTFPCLRPLQQLRQRVDRNDTGVPTKPQQCSSNFVNCEDGKWYEVILLFLLLLWQAAKIHLQHSVGCQQWPESQHQLWLWGASRSWQHLEEEARQKQGNWSARFDDNVWWAGRGGRWHR